MCIHILLSVIVITETLLTQITNKDIQNVQ